MSLMIDCEPTLEDRMSGEDFVALARKILEQRGTENFSNNWVEIRSNYNGLDLQITRQKQIVEKDGPNQHLGVSNPVTMVKDGEVIRHHGEYIYLTAHMRGLVQ